MRLLFISNGYPPHRWAGTETYTASLAHELKRRGHQVQVLCAGAWDMGPAPLNGVSDDLSTGVPVRRLHLNWLKAPDPFRYLYANPVVARYVADFLRQSRPDLVHVTSCETLSASVLRVVKDQGLPLVLSLTDFWFLCPRINLLRSDGINCSGAVTARDCLRCQLEQSNAYRRSRRLVPERYTLALFEWLSRYAVLTRQRGLRGLAGHVQQRRAYLAKAITWPDLRLTASAFARDVYWPNHILAPIEVRAYGHDLNWLRQYSGKTASKRLRIGYIGQITPAKGVHLLVEATNRLDDLGAAKPEVSIYGNLDHDAAYRAQLEAMAVGRSNIAFRGTFRHEEMASAFAEIDVLAVPSLWYDFPLIILEAFAAHTPVVATNLGAMAEWVKPEVNGLLFGRGDPGSLADQFRRLIIEPTLLGHLQKGLPPVKPIQTYVSELEVDYDALIRVRPLDRSRRGCLAAAQASRSSAG
jgi:glycosyltransferase involved in cell wall biosynthesis